MPWARKSLPTKRLTPAEALAKLERYCAYQDRCHHECKQKLRDLGVWGEDADHVMAALIEARFLDEERFARSYARGKHRMKYWGRDRIRRELKQRRLTPYCIEAGLSELDELDYAGTLRTLLAKRAAKQDDALYPYARKQDLIAYAQRKGYELSLAIPLAGELVDAGGT